ISINEYKWKPTGASIIPGYSESKTRFAYKVGVGYKFADTFCAELSYADYGKDAHTDGIKTGQIQLALGYSF
ncbi:MAG: outer membrane beta-barrel protein, partial [Abditibacteriota bacterium]|nr:outer membrane beta-barrel protein [Abditibacteriota bacterium]